MIEIKIGKKQLIDCLLRLRKSFGVKNAFPILNDYKFELDGNKLSVVVSDYETVTKESFYLSDEAIRVENDNRKAWCINRWNIVPGLRTLDEQEITMQVMDYQVRIVHSLGSFSMHIDDAGEFPEPVWNLGEVAVTHLNLEAPGLRHWLDILRPALAQDELRPVMNGILFDCKEDSLSLCASDGHKLVRIRKNNIGGYKQEFIMPRKPIYILYNILPKTGMVDFRFTQEGLKPNGCTIPIGHIEIEFEKDVNHKLEIIFIGIDGRYPNYNSVIPTTYANNISVDRRQFINSLERAKYFSNENNLMAKLHIGNGSIGISTEDKDFELQCDESIPCEIHESIGLPMTIGVKTTGMINLLKRITTKSILMKFQDSSRAIIVEPEPQPDVEDITLLLMPMYCND